MLSNHPHVKKAVHAAIVVAIAAMAPLLGDSSASAQASEQGVGASTRFTVVGVTLVFLVAAALAARSALRNPDSRGPTFNDDLLDTDLLESPGPPGQEPEVVAVFERVFLFVLLGYALLDRGFAWLHVPGTPLFLGEMTLAFGVLAMMSRRVPLRGIFRSSAALRLLVVWMSWGFVFFVLQVPQYGFDAVRDSAIWYYGLVAILTLFMLLSDPTRFRRWSMIYIKVIPFLLLWFPVAMVLDFLFGTGAPFAPDSQVPFFAHRYFNMAIAAAMAMAFIWLVDRPWGRLSGTQRIAYSVIATVVILTVGFQTRGGLIAAVFGIILMLLFMRERRAELVLAGTTVVLGIAAIAIIGNITIPISHGREISAAQMMDNIGSIINPSSGGARQAGTTQWRLDLWTAVFDDVVNEHPVGGFGPGPNLGQRFGVATNEAVPLRNPHNSHLGVMSRMGLVGFVLWAALWIAWTVQLMILRGHLMRRGKHIEAGLAAWLIVSAIMILVNAIFDPTLEGPQVGFWLWFVFGIGVALPAVYSVDSTFISRLRRSTAGVSSGS